jgi:hypothetical protein
MYSLRMRAFSQLLLPLQNGVFNYIRMGEHSFRAYLQIQYHTFSYIHGRINQTISATCLHVIGT